MTHDKAFRLMISFSIAVPTLAAATGHASAAVPPRFNPPKAYYLALGDSIAYGYQVRKHVPGVTAEDFDTGYVDVFSATLRTIRPSIRVVNFSCPGESSTTFIRGGCPVAGTDFPLHDPFSGPQFDAALAFLRAHPGEVSPITITLWANDVRELLAVCGFDLGCIQARVPMTIELLVANLDTILRRIRGVAPQAEIILTGPWDPFVGDFAVADPLFMAMDAAMADVIAANGARFADLFPIFNPQGDEAAETAAICTLLLVCVEGDSHPSDAGYRAIADAVLDVSGYDRLLEEGE
jgi:lysophospholipase L1-like esterase